MPDPIRVGPIVGEVTATTARVVVQADRSASLRLRLVPAGNHASLETEPQELAAGDLAVFELRDLMPLHRYQFTVLADRVPVADRSGRITTKSERPESLQVAAVSCNFTVRQGRARLWERLWDKWVGPGTIETVLHIGDQVYADTAFEQALAEIEANGRSAAVARRIRAGFERLYRAAWNYPATRKVLSGWRTSLAPFRGKGHRERAEVRFEALGDRRFKVEVRVESERNMNLSRPLDPAYAEWEAQADDATSMAILVQRIKGRLGEQIEIGPAPFIPGK